MDQQAWLVLEDGTAFQGRSFGAPVEAAGELVFTTGMVGYLETLTDPSYCGQIIVQTFPMIGNYGIIPQDAEGPAPRCAGYIVHEYAEHPSNFRCQGRLDDYLKAQGIPALCGIDTRAVTRHLRDHGVMNAMICRQRPAEIPASLHAPQMLHPVEAVTCAAPTVHPPKGEKKYAVVLMDYGAKRNILRSLEAHGCEVTAVPAATSAEEVLALKPDGLMLSNGPGDPADNPFCVEQIRRLLGRVPIFGICLGHQLTALAMGGRTEKMKFGHRGANQPVRDLKTGRTWITSQNHGYAVVADSLPREAVVRYVNANDDTCEGIDYPELRAFTTQFHPEACAGSQDTTFLFDRFCGLMDEYQNTAGGQDHAKG